MDLISFLNVLTKLKENRLASGFAHSLLAPPQRIHQFKSMSMTKVKPEKAAVLLLFYPNKSGEVNFVLTRRKIYKGPHSGQISFPGGKPEHNDYDLWGTALRETYEELGVASYQVKYLRSLTQLYVPPSNFLIVPYVGYVDKTCNFSPDSREVDAILEISLECLINKQPVMTKQHAYPIKSQKVPAYVFNQNEVWGATAMILSEFKMLFTSGLPK